MDVRMMMMTMMLLAISSYETTNNEIDSAYCYRKTTKYKIYNCTPSHPCSAGWWKRPRTPRIPSYIRVVGGCSTTRGGFGVVMNERLRRTVCA